jgi:DnaJ-class molecular chaperone
LAPIVAKIRSSRLAVRFDGGRFFLHSIGELTLAQVRDRDGRGVLEWTDDKVRNWVRSQPNRRPVAGIPLDYDLLGAEPGCSQDAIAGAYHRAMLLAHPDAGGETRRAQLVNEAHEALRDPVRRALYDREVGIA